MVVRSIGFIGGGRVLALVAGMIAFLFVVIAGSQQAATELALEATGLGPATVDTTAETRLPKLLDLRAGKCIPCKMMAPIAVVEPYYDMSSQSWTPSAFVIEGYEPWMFQRQIQWSAKP